MYLDAVTRPETFDPLREEIAREAERIGRDLTGFKLGGFCQMRLDDDAASDPRFAFSDQRPLFAGSAEQILEDLEHYATSATATRPCTSTARPGPRRSGASSSSASPRRSSPRRRRSSTRSGF